MLIEDYLEANGVAGGRDPDRANLIARIPGTGEGPSLALLGHTTLSRPTPRTGSHGHLDDDGYIWGRGSVMKNETAAGP